MSKDIKFPARFKDVDSPLEVLFTSVVDGTVVVEGGGYPVGHYCDNWWRCNDSAEWILLAQATFQRGDIVRKKKGSQWKGKIVGCYSTELTPEGYAVESSTHAGSVQIYPVGALELVERRK